MTLGELIKFNRENMGISQRELARRINVDNATISKIEKGIINKVAFDILINLSQELKINIRYLLELSNYSYDEIENLMDFSYNEYDDVMLILEGFDEDDVSKYIITDTNDGIRHIDITKVLSAFKNGYIDEKKAMILIAACKPKIYNNKIIYVTQNGDVEIEMG